MTCVVRAIFRIALQSIHFCALCQQGVGDELRLVSRFAALLDLRVQTPMIFMGVTTLTEIMQQRDDRTAHTILISTAVNRVQDVA